MLSSTKRLDENQLITSVGFLIKVDGTKLPSMALASIGSLVTFT